MGPFMTREFKKGSFFALFFFIYRVTTLQLIANSRQELAAKAERLEVLGRQNFEN